MFFGSPMTHITIRVRKGFFKNIRICTPAVSRMGLNRPQTDMWTDGKTSDLRDPRTLSPIKRRQVNTETSSRENGQRETTTTKEPIFVFSLHYPFKQTTLLYCIINHGDGTQ